MSVHSNSLFTQDLRDRSWLRSRQWNNQYGWHKNHADAWKGTSFDKKWETSPLSTKIDEEKVFSNIHKFGNTTAASVGIALSEALEENKINNNDIVVLVAFGAGFYWASTIIKWHN